ncbi:MAG: EF-hand domain-containing protein [Roseobacter sp.]
MNRSLFIPLLIVSALAVTATQSFAAEGGQRAPVSFEMLDVDGNGQITQAEMSQHRMARLSEADANGDGMLSVAEIAARGTERAKTRADRMMQRLDANSDGLLSSEELSQHSGRSRMFDRIDADGSGSVTKEEFEAAQAKMKERRASR